MEPELSESFPKTSSETKPLNVIVPAAGFGSRLKSTHPKIGTELINGQTLFEVQIETIRKVYPNAQITYITGYCSQDVDKYIKQLNCNIIHNYRYETTNVAFSISKGLEHTEGHTLIILGDLYFESDILNVFTNPSGSCITYDVQRQFDKKEIGINPRNGYFDYSFGDKWSQMVYLDEKDADKFWDISEREASHKKYCWEILQEMVNFGTKFNYIGISGVVLELDRSKDLARINKALYFRDKKNENID